jgi:GT2 family glycosyltransferase
MLFFMHNSCRRQLKNNLKDTMLSFSIVICTANRSDLLEHCLRSLSTEQSKVSESYEILVVDNDSYDATKSVAESFRGAFPHFQYVLEKQKGLSVCRNIGCKHSKGRWVVYLDDDTIVSENFLGRLTLLSTSKQYDIVGGAYEPWYHYGRPKWFMDQYVNYKLPYQDLSLIKKIEYVSGCIMMVRKEVFDQIGFFHDHLGMKGDSIGYGEETEFQFRAREQGLIVGYDPKLIVKHIVRPQKLKVSWFLNAAFAAGRDQVFAKESPPTYAKLLVEALIALSLLLLTGVLNSFKLFRSSYYAENWIIDVLKKFSKRIGYIYTGLVLKLEGREEALITLNKK